MTLASAQRLAGWSAPWSGSSLASTLAGSLAVQPTRFTRHDREMMAEWAAEQERKRSIGS